MTDRPLTGRIRGDGRPLDLRAYEQAGGYQGLRKALALSPRDVQETVIRSGLRGRGGAGFPTGRKWSAVALGPEARRPKYLLVNADEMEPGTMKDRWLLEGDPHQLIEGAAIAAYAIEAEQAYIYLRGEYHRAAEALEHALAEARGAGYIGDRVMGNGYRLDMRLHLSAGRYMCGEESGLIDALEGRRGTPRSKPPYPQVSGLWGKPTVVNNVETLCNVPHILANGPEWYKGLSETGGTKIYGASGRVQRPGLWELPLGATMREILEEHAGGMQQGRRFRGLLPGGGSTRFVVEEHLDVKMDFESMSQAGSRLGTGTMIVLDDGTCPIGMLTSLEAFFARESCGWCTPCREGLPWIERILRALEAGQGEPGDIEVLEQHTRFIGPGTTYCALAPGAMEPLVSALTHFRGDFERHIGEHRCPWR